MRVEQPPAAAAAALDVASAQRGAAAPVLQARDVRADARGHAAAGAGDPFEHHGAVGPLHHLDLLGAGDLDEQDLYHHGVLGLLRGEQALGGLERVTAGRQRVVGAGGALGVVPAAPVRADDPLHLAHDPVVDLRAEGGARDGQDDGAGHRDHAQVLHGRLATVAPGAPARALLPRPAEQRHLAPPLLLVSTSGAVTVGGARGPSAGPGCPFRHRAGPSPASGAVPVRAAARCRSPSHGRRRLLSASVRSRELGRPYRRRAPTGPGGDRDRGPRFAPRRCDPWRARAVAPRAPDDHCGAEFAQAKSGEATERRQRGEREA